MTTRPSGRFTFDGSDDVETRTAAVVRDVGREVERAVRGSELEALLLIGGYGRGEGGVEVVDGVEVPHNNLDFLLVSRRGDPGELRRRVEEPLQRLARERGIGIDVGVVAASTLRRAPCRVMWYDMRHGHKTVLGNDAFAPSLRKFTVDRILPAEARDLLTNRGTLLVINDVLLARGDLDALDRKLVVKHVVKAIIGYGDALLFFLGEYDWSYAEKRARMRRRADVDGAFRALYDEAVAFRFRPAYDQWLARDLPVWMRSVEAQLSTVHRTVEAHRLGRALPTWDGYVEAALAHVLREDLSSPRALASKARNLLTRPPRAPSLPRQARAGLALAGPRGTLPLVFPAVVYDDAGASERTLAAEILGVTSRDRHALRLGYLRRWGVVGDTNFRTVLARHRIDLSEAATA